MDLFCGVGGASAGISRYPQFNVVAGIDSNVEAIGSFCTTHTHSHTHTRSTCNRTLIAASPVSCSPRRVLRTGHNTDDTTAAIHADVDVFLPVLQDNYDRPEAEWPHVDVLVACPPCQPFSTANRCAVCVFVLTVVNQAQCVCLC